MREELVRLEVMEVGKVGWEERRVKWEWWGEMGDGMRLEGGGVVGGGNLGRGVVDGEVRGILEWLGVWGKGKVFVGNVGGGNVE